MRIFAAEVLRATVEKNKTAPFLLLFHQLWHFGDLLPPTGFKFNMLSLLTVSLTDL